MRWLGVDIGQRRIGLAISDPSGTLARPWQTVAAAPSPVASAAVVVAIVAPLLDEPDGLAGVVVGLPRRLDGRDTDQTPAARAFADAVGAQLPRPVFMQDERLTSHEAEERLAVRERDWRKRKPKLDAVAAAIILQDYLDEHARSASHLVAEPAPPSEC